MCVHDENFVAESCVAAENTLEKSSLNKASKRYPVEDSAYKISFLRCLTVVYETEIYLFSTSEAACLSHFIFSLSDNARYLFARLFLRTQRKWFRESDYLQYDRDCDVLHAVDDLLIPFQYLPESEDFGKEASLSTELISDSFLFKFDYEQQSLVNILELLSLAELKSLKSSFKVSSNRKALSSVNGSKSSSLSRGALIKELAKVSTQASLASFFKPVSSKGKSHSTNSSVKSNGSNTDLKLKLISEAKSLLGANVIRLNPFVYKTISKAFTAYFRVKDFDVNYVECALLNEMSINNFPSYTIHRDNHFFSSRNELTDYEEALILKYEVDNLIADRASDRKKQKAADLFEQITSRLESALQAASFSSSFHEDDLENRSSITQAIAFTPEWVGTKAVLMLCTGLFGNFVSEWKFLDLFLSQRVYHRAQRGKAYIRKAILEMNQLSGDIGLAQELSGIPVEDREQFSESLITAYHQFNPTSTLPKRKRSTGAQKPSAQNPEKQGADSLAVDDKLSSGTKLFWTRRALQTCIQGLEDASVHEVFHIDLKKRIIRLERQLKIPMSSRHDFSHIPLKPAVSRTIKCNRIYESSPEVTIEYPTKSESYFRNKEPSPATSTIISTSNSSNPFKRPSWVDIEGTRDSVNVEEASLSYYRTLGWEGVHSENSMLGTLFALLFWDILFSPINCGSSTTSAAGIFEHHCQAFPLDLFSKMFYRNRKEAIDERLKLIRNDLEFVKKQVKEVHNREYPRQTICIGVSWYPLDALLTILEGIGSPALATICDHLAKNYRVLKSGMPDLCLWKVSTKECMFSEVKSENDTLSDKQCYWIDILVNAGVKVEVCHVLEPKSYFKKLKMS